MVWHSYPRVEKLVRSSDPNLGEGFLGSRGVVRKGFKIWVPGSQNAYQESGPFIHCNWPVLFYIFTFSRLKYLALMQIYHAFKVVFSSLISIGPSAKLQIASGPCSSCSASSKTWSYMFLASFIFYVSYANFSLGKIDKSSIFWSVLIGAVLKTNTFSCHEHLGFEMTTFNWLLCQTCSSPCLLGSAGGLAGWVNPPAVGLAG